MAATLGGTKDVVEVVLVRDAFIRKINREHRGVDRATDVISFSYLEDDHPCGENIAGEIYVSYETVQKEAKRQAVNPKHLFLRVGVHGLFHVLGYTHETNERAREMEAEERRILGTHLDAETLDALF